jgi:putative transposase
MPERPEEVRTGTARLICDNRFFPRESPEGKYEEEPMRDWKSLSHVRWDCKYHIVFVSKYRKETIYGKFREKIGSIIRDLCRQKGIELLEGHAMSDHIHLCLSIPPKYSVSNTVGFIKGKSAIRIHRELLGIKRMTGLSFWATGYCVSTVGLDEETIRKYIRDQRKLEKE